MKSSIIVWTVYRRTDEGYVEIGSGIAQSIQERLDILDLDQGFKSVASMMLPRMFMVPNGVRVVGYDPERKVGAPFPQNIEMIEWLLTIPEDRYERAEDEPTIHDRPPSEELQRRHLLQRRDP